MCMTVLFTQHPMKKVEERSKKVMNMLPLCTVSIVLNMTVYQGQHLQQQCYKTAKTNL